MKNGLNKRFSVVLVAGLLLMSACGPSGREVSFSGETMGTFYTVKYVHADKAVTKEKTDSLLEELNNVFSTYQEESVISQINRSDDPFPLDEPFAFVLKEALRLAELTEGAFEPTILPLVELWGFGGAERRDVADRQVDSVLSFVGFDKISIKGDSLYKHHPGVRLDLNAIAKGFSVDELGRLLERHGIENYLVGIAGDMRARGKNANGNWWRIGIEKPIEDLRVGEGILKVTELENASISTSGDYRNFYYDEDGRKYAHIIDPRTGYPAMQKLLSASIIHKSCMMADAMATSSMVMGIDESAALLDATDVFEYVLIIEGEDGAFRTILSDGAKQQVVQ